MAAIPEVFAFLWENTGELSDGCLIQALVKALGKSRCSYFADTQLPLGSEIRHYIAWTHFSLTWGVFNNTLATPRSEILAYMLGVRRTLLAERSWWTTGRACRYIRETRGYVVEHGVADLVGESTVALDGGGQGALEPLHHDYSSPGQSQC